MLLLSFGPKYHSISMDSFLFKKQEYNSSDFLKTSIIINFTILLMGISYLFPGIWKFVFSGFEWAFSDNLKYKLLSKWLELDGWLPLLRIDKFPILYQGAAFTTLIFELTFFFGVISKKLRPFYIVIGLGFHLMVTLTMKITFWPLIILYASFIDWSRLINSKEVIILTGNQVINGLKTKLGVLAIFIFSMSFLSGATLIKSWPFAVYPTFASIEKSYHTTLAVKLDLPDEKEAVLIPLLKINEYFKEDFQSSELLRGYIDAIVIGKNESNMISLANIILKKIPAVEAFTFYPIRISTDPDKNYEIVEEYEQLGIFTKEEL